MYKPTHPLYATQTCSWVLIDHLTIDSMCISVCVWENMKWMRTTLDEQAAPCVYGRVCNWGNADLHVALYKCSPFLYCIVLCSWSPQTQRTAFKMTVGVILIKGEDLIDVLVVLEDQIILHDIKVCSHLVGSASCTEHFLPEGTTADLRGHPEGSREYRQCKHCTGRVHRLKDRLLCKTWCCTDTGVLSNGGFLLSPAGLFES